MADSPYPGLRAFEQSESHLFFGREQALSDMIEKLRRHRFLAVTGPSGCGKSSLIKAGLLEELNSGFLSGEGPWRTVMFRPGNRPLRAMAEALTQSYGVGQDSPELLEARLSTQENALVGWLDFIGAEDETLFLVVDQFEEIFRFEDTDTNDERSEASQREEVEEFVDTLLRATESQARKVYVVITMRIDFLGDCATVPGLIEAINDSHFLTPRMTRLQCGEAIREPARVFGGEVDDKLVTGMLNDLALVDGVAGSAAWTNPDLLPLLQNVLARMWRQAQGRQGVKLTMAHYDNVGRLSGALNAALNGIYNALNPTEKKLAERIFKFLVQPESTHRARDVRRPASVADIVTATGADIAAVRRVVDEFRAEGRNFLMPPPATPLNGATIIDISHESLIRQWERLQEWVREEQRSAEIYRQLENHARTAADNSGDLLSDRQLHVFEPWWEETEPTAAWAARYGSSHEEAFDFYRQSIARRNERRENERKAIEAEILKKQRWRAMFRQFGLYIGATAAALVLGLGFLLYSLDRQSKISRSIAAADRATQLVHDGLPFEALEIIQEVLPRSLGGEHFLWPYEPRAEAALYLTLDALRSQWVLPGHRGAINAADVAERERVMATASADGFARLWNLGTSERMGAWAHPNLVEVVDIAVSDAPIGDNHWLASTDAAGVARLWSIASRTPLAVLSSPSARAATFSPDSARLYVLRDDGSVDVYSTTAIAENPRITAPVETLRFRRLGAVVQAGENEYPPSWRIAVAPDVDASAGVQSETLFVSGPNTGAIAMRIAIEPKPTVLRELRLRGGHGPADISPDGSMAAVVDPEGIQIWDLRGPRARYITPPGRVTALSFSVDNAQLLIAGERSLQALTLANDTLSPIVTPANIANLRTLTTTAAGPSGSRWNVVIGEQERGVIGVYRPESSSRILAGLSNEQITATAISGNGQFVALAVRGRGVSRSSEIRVINTESGDVVRRLPGHAGGWRISEFSRNGTLVYSVRPDNRVLIARASDGVGVDFDPGGDVLGIAEGTDNGILVASRTSGSTAPEVRLAAYSRYGALLSQSTFDGDFRGLWTSSNGEYFLLAVDGQNDSVFGATRGLRALNNGRFQIGEPLLTDPFSSGSRWGLALTAGSTRTPIVLDLFRDIRSELPGGPASSLFVSPSDQRIAVTQPTRVRVFQADANGGLSAIYEPELTEPQLHGQFGSDSNHFVTVGIRGAITRFSVDGRTSSVVRDNLSEARLSPGFLFDSNLTYGAFLDDQRLRVFELTRGRSFSDIGGVCAGTLTELRMERRTPDAVVIDCGDNELPFVQSWDLGTRSIIGTTPWASATPGARVFADNGNVLVGSAALVMARQDHALTPRYDLPRDAPRNGEVSHLAVSDDGSLVASYGEDQYLRIWGADQSEIAAASIGASQIRFLRFASENRIVMATGDGYIRVWSVEGGSLTETGVARQTNLHVANLSPDGTAIATGSTSGEICVWQLRQLGRPANETLDACNTNERFSLADGQPVEVIGFTFDNEVVAVGQQGGIATSTANTIARQAGAIDNVVIGGAVNPSDGSVLLSRLDGTTLATPNDGAEIRIPSPLSRTPGPRFVAGGRMVLAPMSDGTVQLLESSGGGLVAVLGRRGNVPRVVHEARGDHVILIYDDDVIVERVGGIQLDSAPSGRFLVGPSLRDELIRYVGASSR